MKSLVIPLTTLMTVGGQAGVHVADTATLSLYLRRFDDSGTYIEEIAGDNLGGGAWKFDVPEGNYQLWKSAYPDNTPSNRIDKWHGGALNYRRIQDEEDPKYLKVTGGIMSGDIDMGGLYTIYGVKDPATGADIMDRDYADSRYALKTEVQTHWQISSNIVIVDANVSDIAGKYYNTIQEAINYAQSQSPSASNRFAILIMPHKNKTSGYSENITLQQYVDLIGIGLVKINGGLSGSSANIRLENLFWQYDGNLTIANLKALNTIFRSYETAVNGGRVLTVDSGKFSNCGFYCISPNSTAVISNGSNIFINCHVNCNFDKQNTDKGDIYSFGDAALDYSF